MENLTHTFSKTKKFLVLCILAVILMSACAPVNQAPPPQSDSDENFNYGAEIPIDDNIYTLEVMINSEMNSLTEQLSQSSLSGYSTGSFGYVSGYGNSWQEGKGFIRVKVVSINPYSEYVAMGDNVIIKTTDTKMRALIPNDIVMIKCRMQYESVAAVRQNEVFDNAKEYETWELDYCRMITPQLENK